MNSLKTTNEPNADDCTLSHPDDMSPESLALLGDGKIAYVKAVAAEEVAQLYPQAPQLAPGTRLFALHAADGTPILLTDSREAAVANAWSHELETVSVH